MSEYTSNFITLTFGINRFLATATPNSLIFNKISDINIENSVLNMETLKYTTLESIVVPFSTYEELATFKS
jgi:hypothetical protein